MVSIEKIVVLTIAIMFLAPTWLRAQDFPAFRAYSSAVKAGELAKARKAYRKIPFRQYSSKTLRTARMLAAKSSYDEKYEEIRLIPEPESELFIYQSEDRLRKAYRTLWEQSEVLEKALVEKPTSVEVRADLEDVKGAMAEIADQMPVTDGNLFQTFFDYEPYFFTFNLGFEWITIKESFKKEKPRIGLLLYNRILDPPVRESMIGFGWYGLHNILTARLTSSGEQPSTPEQGGEQGGAGGTTVNLGDKSSLEFEIAAFAPLWRVKKSTGPMWIYIGPIMTYGGRKTDERDRIDERYYGGLRLAFNPEMFTDLIYGKSEGTIRHRLEVRGQMPIYRLSNDSKFNIGGICNLGLNNDPRINDSVRIYVSWDVEVKDIFAIFK